MPEDRTVLRRVAWRDIFPWLMLFRCFGLSITLPVLALGVLGAAVMPWGGRMVRQLIPAVSPDNRLSADGTVIASDDATPHPADALAADGLAADALPMGDFPAGPWTWIDEGRSWMSPVGGANHAYFSLVAPAAKLFDRRSSLLQFLGNLLITLWNIAVWALCGGAITRIAVVQFGREERLPVREALKHTVRNYGWYFSAPLFPLLGVVVMGFPLILIGVLVRLDFLAAAAGFVWPVMLLMGLAMAILLLGLLGGWPLMFPTISAEEDSDAFDAFSRSFSYTFQRPLQYLFYAVVAVAFSQLSFFLVDHFADAVISLTNWGLTWGAGRLRVSEMLGATGESGALLNTTSEMIAWWNGFVRIVVQGFNFSLFFCLASVIYLLLRREVDQTDFDEVYMPDDDTRFGLPALHAGPAGVPEVEEKASGGV